MKMIIVGFVSLLVTALPCGPAAAWSHANRWGGSTSHSYGSGSTTRSSAWGGSETHTYGQGTTATSRYGTTATHQQGSNSTSFSGAYGGSATHTYGQGTTATNRYGTTATHGYGSGYTTVTNPSGATAYHATRPPAYYRPPAAHYPYHPPTTVNVYGSGCYNCGGWSTAGAGVTVCTAPLGQSTTSEVTEVCDGRR